jgi:hypothetical protein
VVVVACVCAATSHTDADADDDPRPWARGVSADEQARATDLFEQGNKLLDEGLFAQALDLYRQAIAHWPHPAIRYNAAVALINLQRQLEAYEELEASLAYGKAGLQPDVYDQALAYQRLLGAQVVHLRVDCVDPDTQITLDDQPLAVPCPGSHVQLLLPGRHQLAATRPGAIARAIELTPSGGDAPHVVIDLMTTAEATIVHRRWAHWKPWVAVAAAGVVAGVGLGFELQAAATFRSYDKAVAELCPDGPCATLPNNVVAAYDEGRLENRIAIGCFIGSAATLAAGALLLWLNRPIAERLGYTSSPFVGVQASGGGGSVTAGLAF